MRTRITAYRDQWKYRNYRKTRERNYGDVMTVAMTVLAALLVVAVVVVLWQGQR